MKDISVMQKVQRKREAAVDALVDIHAQKVVLWGQIKRGGDTESAKRKLRRLELDELLCAGELGKGYLEKYKPLLEVWQPVRGCEGKYEVSQFGEVRSLNYGKRKGVVCILEKWINRKGFAMIKLKSRYVSLGAVVLEAFACQRPDNNFACHLDRDHANDSLHNLEWRSKTEQTYWANHENKSNSK